MKRIITYISILAAALTAGVSCSQDLSFDENQDGGNLTLVFRTEQMGTRVTVNDADPIKGVGAENTIEHIDYFFFPDDNPTSEAVVYGRLTVDQLTKVSETEYKYDGFDTSKSEYASLKGPSYLYVLANYPEEVNVKTMQGLLALPISTDFTKEQTSFVMDSYDSAEESALLFVTPKATDSTNPREVEVKLARAAAKLVLKINVTNSYTDDEGNVWRPEVDQMWVNFLYARKNTTVAALPVAFDNKSNFIDTAQQTPTSTTAVDAGHTSWLTTPVYTYPQSYETSDVTAPYYKIFCPWVCDKMGLTNFYYKIILPQLGSFLRNKVYTLTVDLSVIGGTEDWALVSDHIYVADWWAPAAIESSFEGAMYLDVPVKEYEIYGVNDVYIPVRSSNDIQITNIRGTKTNLYNGNTETVTGSTSDVSKEGFRFVHALNNDIKSTSFDCTPITFNMTVRHTQGGLSKTVNVKITQYPPIYAKADLSNQYVFVNYYSRKAYGEETAYNNNRNGAESLGSLNQVGEQGSLNNNNNQYVVTVSVLPDGYKVAGMTEEAVIGDPRGGRLASNNLGYDKNGDVQRTVQQNYNAVSSTTQNVIAPAIRIASSWGAMGSSSTMRNYDRAEERCAAYQENGYPAGRWRVPTLAEIDFLMSLSDYNHIPQLFTPTREDTRTYDVYWAGGKYAYGGTPYLNDKLNQANHSQSFVNLSNATNTGDLLRITVNGRYEYFDTYVRCVYDEWYWGSQKYGNNGQPTTGSAATQWLGYIY